MKVCSTYEYNNPSCRLIIKNKLRQFTVGVSVCMVIVENTVYLENYQNYPLNDFRVSSISVMESVAVCKSKTPLLYSIVNVMLNMYESVLLKYYL